MSASGMQLPTLLSMAQKIVGGAVVAGSTVVDCTVGNGKDTLFLARLVGPKGTVFGFDVQKVALERTRARLVEVGLAERVRLTLAGHEELEVHIPDGLVGRISACMFNLGYLPGAKRRVTTHAQSTVRALSSCVNLLADGGVVTIVTYSGHPGGREEHEVVRAWCTDLPVEQYSVIEYGYANNAGTPRLFAVEKVAS